MYIYIYNIRVQTYVHEYMYTIASEKLQRAHSLADNPHYKYYPPAHSGKTAAMERAKSVNMTLVVHGLSTTITTHHIGAQG